ncbi:vWA domain-containing protein [Roseateles terrae]|uniref:60 kDa SS-A/Ro ribonucleoprotein n=1 Tax=Roseateles terrae TaxID=431060 RepID=A0ABR6GXN1_9BURK|nr:RNA-binding protein [Roseateles terrae]MBB3196864.1 60 kDa SS-A/Ro ribonucleoprotein [Roseateles terrae]OWQ84580.1 RNA-binding protein [Roseateles terrae]
MVNMQLFQTLKGALLPAATARNAEQAPAYALTPRHQLAQLAATGCLTRTYYANADAQLEQVLALTEQLDPAFVAKAAIYGRQSRHMKDMPALLAASLAVRDVALLAQVFPRIIDSGKMLRNFVQILRSGAVGRKSLGSRPKKLVQQWLLAASEKQLLNAAVGNAPSLADVVKMVHPKPTEAWREAWFAWLIGRAFDETALPPITQAFERFKRLAAQGTIDANAEAPAVPFQMLTALPLTSDHWAQIARQGSWQMIRQKLNTLARHGVFELPGMSEAVAAKLRDAQAVSQARAMPYQLLSAFKAAADTVPAEVRDALQDAMELALTQVPAIAGRVVVCPDVSGSMSSPVTGHRGTASSSVRCIDVAALVAAAVLRKNPQARVLPFEQEVVTLQLNSRDSVMTHAQALAAIGGGGTNCSAPLALLNKEKALVDVVILVSDNESWVDAVRRGATQTLREWELLKQRNPQARLVCIDIQPTVTTQVAERADILNVGGFSDAVFTMMAEFIKGSMNADHWVGDIEKLSLAAQ